MAYWTPKDYTPFFLHDEPTHTDKEVRAEYSRLRDILQKRGKRLYEAGFIAQAVELDVAMPPLKEVSSMSQVKDRLANAHALYENPLYSMKGIKNIWKDFRSNFDPGFLLGEVLGFHEYMKSWRTSMYRHLVSTNEAMELYYNEYQEAGGTFDTFYSVYSMDKRNKR